DIGKINQHYFCNSTAIGTIPKAVQQVKPNKKKWLGALAYFIEGFKVLRKNKAYTFHIEVDGEQFSEKSILVLVSSSFSVGGMETLIPDAQVNDGNLHLIVLKGAKVWDKLNILPKLITGTITKDNQVIYRKFKKGKIRIEENEEVFCNVDGEKGDSLPIELTILEKHLTVFTTPKQQRK
ncbi:MAG: diacylglycerol kinase family lipid kinase, partial [Pisciglobus halotolerans]|nr:diacylglycerol kinase family lipid kinase [Pisciglobus halotolerans]